MDSIHQFIHLFLSLKLLGYDQLELLQQVNDTCLYKLMVFQVGLVGKLEFIKVD